MSDRVIEVTVLDDSRKEKDLRIDLEQEDITLTFPDGSVYNAGPSYKNCGEIKEKE